MRARISPDGRIKVEPELPKGRLTISADGWTIGISETVSSIAISRDGKWLAAGSWNGLVRLWDTQEGQPATECSGHSGAVRSICFSTGAQLMASTSDDNTLRLWQTSTGECVDILFFDGKVTATFVDGCPLRLVIGDQAGRAFGYDIMNIPAS